MFIACVFRLLDCRRRTLVWVCFAHSAATVAHRCIVFWIPETHQLALTLFFDEWYMFWMPCTE